MEVLYSGSPTNILRWRVRKGQMVTNATVLCTLSEVDCNGEERRVISKHSGRVSILLKKEGDPVTQGDVLLRVEVCKHDIVIKDLCAECGVNLRTIDGMPGERTESASASVAMVHNIPELYVSEEKANELADEDTQRLLNNRKLVLLIDLDQTLIHTTCDDVPVNLEDVHHFQLPPGGQGAPFYHTKFRPGTKEFLEKMSALYELHIVTFGNRLYAHTIARLLDPETKYFGHRILSRDEAFNPLTKTANLKSLFPRGDSMVCIIDDRAEVWSFSKHLIHVKPYKYFRDTDDINLPGQENGHRPRASFRDSRRQKQPTSASHGQRTTKNAEHGVKEEKTEEDKDVEEEEDEDEEVNIDEEETTREQSPKVKTDKTEEAKSTIKEKCANNEGGNGESSKTKVEGQESKADGEEEEVEIKEEIEEEIKQEMEEEVNEEIKQEMEEEVKEEIEEEIKQEMEEEVKEEIKQEMEEEVKEETKEESEEMKSGEDPEEEDDEEGTSVKSEPKTEEDERETSKKAKKKAKKVKESREEKTGKADVVTAEEDAHWREALEDEEEEDERLRREENPWEDHDDYLIYLAEILQRIHKAYYIAYDASSRESQLPDMKEIIPRLRRNTLRSVRLVFSGVVPLGHSVQQSGAYHLARHLGADVQQELEVSGSRRTNYVIASRAGTRKVSAARRARVRVVSPHWLWETYYRWQRLSGRQFRLRRDYDPNSFDFNDRKRPLPPADFLPNEEAGGDKDRMPKGKKARVEAEESPGASTSSSSPASSSRGPHPSLDFLRNPLMQISPKETMDMEDEVEAAMLDDDDDDDEEEQGAGQDGRRPEDEDDEDDEEEDDEEEEDKTIALLLGQSVGDSSAESTEDSLSGADFPKGWRPRRGADGRSVSSEEEDREYRTCPEGYDYADAEYTRRVLRDDISSSEGEVGASGTELTDEEECMDALRAFI